MKNKTANKKHSDHMDEVRQALDKYKRRFAGRLSQYFNRLSPRSRKTILISSGFLIAALCFRLVFAPGEFKFSFGAIHRITTPASLDSARTTNDSINHSKR